MASTLRIRVRCPSVSPSPIQLEGCTGETTFAEFQGKVLRALGIELVDGHEHQPPIILAGFPPRPLDLARDASIGSALSDNESVTVRLANQAAGGANPAGGKWGRSKSKRATSSAPARASTRSETSGKTPGSDDRDSAPSVAAGSPKGKGRVGAKKNHAGTSSDGSNPTRAASNETKAGAGGSSTKRGSGVHTLGGPISPSSSRAAASGRAAGPTVGSPPGRIHTLLGSGNIASATDKGNRGSHAAGKGGELSSRKRARVGRDLGLSSEGDIADRLLKAVGGGGGGTVDRFFRKAMKLAVDKQYDQSRADARVRAALGGWYKSEAGATQRRLGDGEPAALKVVFSKGLGAKSQFEETVDRIPREQVSAVVSMIARDPESREMLKPHNFAGCSPRMFWSLVEYWGGDVPRALRLASPGVDWSFLETRDRKLSEKAAANALAKEEERREKERAKEAKRKDKERKRRKKEGLPSEESDDGQEVTSSDAAGGQSVAPEGATGVDHPTEDVQGDRHEDAAATATAAAATTSADARQRAANAALARLMSSQQRARRPQEGLATGNIETSETPMIVQEGGGQATGDATAASSDGSRSGCANGNGKEVEVDMEGLAELAGEAGARLLVAAGVKTLGQLADRDEEELARELRMRRQGTLVGGGGCDGDSELAVGVEQVSEWVQAARGEELDDIMADIVGGEDDVLEALEEVAVSTPRDLVRLGAFPDVLVGAVRDKVGAERWAPLEGLVTCAAVDAWRRKGDELLEQRPWLELWVHQG